MFTGHHVGYGSLEKLLDEANSIHAALYADTITISENTPMGLENQRTYIQVAFLDGATTHFWRWHISSVLLTSHGEAMDPSRAKRAEVANETAWPLIHDHLLKSAARVIQAVVAMPRDLVLLEGRRPDFIVHDNQTSAYILEVTHVA